jgi:hypothetical protein
MSKNFLSHIGECHEKPFRETAHPIFEKKRDEHRLVRGDATVYVEAATDNA